MFSCSWAGLNQQNTIQTKTQWGSLVHGCLLVVLTHTHSKPSSNAYCASIIPNSHFSLLRSILCQQNVDISHWKSCSVTTHFVFSKSAYPSSCSKLPWSLQLTRTCPLMEFCLQRMRSSNDVMQLPIFSSGAWVHSKGFFTRNTAHRTGYGLLWQMYVVTKFTLTNIYFLRALLLYTNWNMYSSK